VLGSIFQILFKYPLLVFQEGRFVLGAPGLLPWAAALATAFGVSAPASPWRPSGPGPWHSSSSSC
jgi:hypothetical protein